MKASTILETIVALVIILAVFGIATTIFIRVGAVAISMRKLSAEQVLRHYAETTWREHLFFDSDERINGYEASRRVTEVQDETGLWRIHFYIYDHDHMLLTDWQQYVLAE
jgi:hypothetical protein